MEFRVLGPIEVQADGHAVRLPGFKSRMLLARLLVDADCVVPVEVLADAVWGDSVPANVANSIQSNVSKLRHAIELHVGEAVAQATIGTRGRGYVVRLDGHEFDARRAGRLLADSRVALREGAPERAADAARQVLNLYRGEPFADVAYLDWAQPEIHRLEELRLEATDALHTARLELGRHTDVIAELEVLVAAHPFRERLRGLLMLALYRAGRQADALRCYSEGRRQLVDELGIEPGPELRGLEARILAQDPELDLTARIATLSQASLIGRDSERRQLKEALDKAQSMMQVVMIHGEPGVGKTALADWLAGEASTTSAIVAHGRAPVSGSAPPFWPWTEALRSIAERHPSALIAMAAADVDLLGNVVPGLGGATGTPTGGSPVVMFDAVSRFLAAAGTISPVVVILDDLHWADEATLELFQFVARSRPPSPILLVGLARPDVATEHPLRAVVADLITQPQVMHLGLGGLEHGDVVELVTTVTGTRPDDHLAATLRERTGGNPFFIREILRVATDDRGCLDLSLVAVPGSVRDVIRSRVARLGPDAENVFTTLSFARDAFTTVLPDHLLDLPPGHVMSIVDEGLAAGLLVDVPGRVGLYRFAHSLIRHVFYDSLPASRRGELHLRVGHVLEQIAPRPMEIANELAWHYTNASNVGGAPEAVHWERLAAEVASSSLAHHDAVHHLRRALASVRKVLRDDALECEVLAELVEAARCADDDATAAAAQRRLQVLRGSLSTVDR